MSGSYLNFVLNASDCEVEVNLPKKEYEESEARRTKIGSMFQSNRVFSKLGINKDVSYLKDIFYAATGKNLDLHEVTKADFKKFKWEMQDREQWINQGFDGTASGFKVLQANLKRIPGGDALYHDIARISAYHRQHTRDNNNKITRINDNVAKIAKDLGINVETLSELEATLQQAYEGGNKLEITKAEQAIDKYLGGYDSDVPRELAGDLFLSVRDVLENTPVDQLRRRDFTDPDGKATIPWSTKHQAMFKEIQRNWFAMRKDLLGVLLNAIRAEKRIVAQTDRNEMGRRQLTAYLDKLESYITTLEFQQTNANTPEGRRYNLSGEEIREFGLNDRLKYKMNDELGYMPHYVLSIATDLKKFQDWATNQTNDQRTAFEVFSDQVALWEGRGGVIDRVKSRQDVNQEYYSKNPFLFLSRYMHEVSSYNHANSMKEAMIGVHNMFINFARNGKNMGDPDSVEKFIEQSEGLMNQISDNLLGQGVDPDGVTGKIQKFTTGLMFIRTMGFNPRSALRNAGQRLLERIKIGFWVQGAAKRYLESDINIKNLMNREAGNHGIIWSQDSAFLDKLNKAWLKQGSEGTKGSVEERTLLPGLMETVNADGTRSVKMIDPSAADTLLRFVEGVAKTGSTLHTMVENMNRFGTFRVGFATAHKNLSKQPDWWINQEMGVESSTYDQRQAWIGRMSGRIAYSLVSDVHFEYGKVFKPQVFQEGGGAILGQFQHYRFSLANLQHNTFKRGWRDIKSGDFSGFGAREAVRMFMAYGIINGITALTGVGISNILSNDNYEWAKNKWLFLTAERDEEGNLTEEGLKQAEQATYGVGTWGDLGPAVGTILEVGEMAHWWSVDMNSFLPMLQHSRPENLEEEDYNYRLARLVNIAGARFRYHTFPALMNQHWWKAIMTETGLYTDYETQKQSREYFKWARNAIGMEDPQNLRNPLRRMTSSRKVKSNRVQPNRVGR